MADPYLGEIRVFSFAFAPRGWAQCNGQQLPIAQNSVLYSILGVRYGGDGRTTFALPNLMGRAPMQFGTGPGLSPRPLGVPGGAESVTLTLNQTPVHSHLPQGVRAVSASEDPTDRTWGLIGLNQPKTYGPPTNLVAMNPETLTPTGGSQPHSNMQPALVMNFCICLDGIRPPQA